MPEPVVLPSGDTLYPGETMAMPQQTFILPGADSTAAPATGDFAAPCASTSSCGTIDGTLFRDEDRGRSWVHDMRLPFTWAWVAAADQAARAADQAEEKAQAQRLQAQEATRQASDLRGISADKAEEKIVTAVAAEAAAADAEAQRKKASMAREVAKFGHRVGETLDDYVVTQTARDTP